MSTAAVKIEPQSTGVVEFNQFEADLAEYKARYENVVYDLTVPEQDKQARSDRLSIGKKIAELDRVHAAVKAPLKAQVDLLDGERKRIKDGLLGIQDGIKSQIAEHEAAIKAVADALLHKAMQLAYLSQFETQPTISVVRDRIAQLKSTVIDDSYGDQQALAALNKEKSLQVLEPMLLGLEAQEKAAAEAEQARIEAENKAREEREARIAAEAKEQAEREAAAAANKAKQDAEAAIERERQAKAKAEQDARDTAERAKKQAQDAAEKAERDKQEAVARAEAEAKRKAEQVERDRLAAIEQEHIATEKREANKKHCAKINNAAVEALLECGISTDEAKAVVSAIAKGQIPAVSIKY
jgi:colicin import membrane protein